MCRSVKGDLAGAQNRVQLHFLKGYADSIAAEVADALDKRMGSTG